MLGSEHFWSGSLHVEETILSERADEQAGYDVYTRVSRWTQTPARLELAITFDDAERIAGFHHPQSLRDLLGRPAPISASYALTTAREEPKTCAKAYLRGHFPVRATTASSIAVDKEGGKRAFAATA